jgi:tRNA G10  N-methylase Trm11
VFYAQAGQPAFPVRLASEIFQRSMEHWQAAGGRGPCTLYDPVCGGAYWLVVLAYLHWQEIAAIYASDVDTGVLSLAERNLSLLTPAGLDRRMAEIEAMMAAYHKESHAGALVSAENFRQQLNLNLGSHAIETSIFQADAMDALSMSRGLKDGQADLVLADVPYGWHSQWQEMNRESGRDHMPVWQMLEALHHLLQPGAVVAIAADKSQKAKHERYRRLERFQIGRRRVFILQPQ